MIAYIISCICDACNRFMDYDCAVLSGCGLGVGVGAPRHVRCSVSQEEREVWRQPGRGTGEE